MTAEEIGKLSDDELRVKVAELCGWVTCKSTGLIMDGWMHTTKKTGWTAFNQLPNYPSDLNAMHEAEVALFHRRIVEGIKPYYENLRRIIDADPIQKDYPIDVIWLATSRQRAKAFVITMQ